MDMLIEFGILGLFCEYVFTHIFQSRPSPEGEGDWGEEEWEEDQEWRGDQAWEEGWGFFENWEDDLDDNRGGRIVKYNGEWVFLPWNVQIVEHSDKGYTSS
jgi:hypothetical protein